MSPPLPNLSKPVPSFAALITLALSVSTLAAQGTDGELRQHFRRGMGALESGDYATYAASFEKVVGLIPEGDINRPFMMYHSARARAFTGDSVAAARWLDRIVDEGIEALMIWYATFDPAFDGVRASAPVRDALGRMREVPVTARRVQGSVLMLAGAGATLAASVGPDGTLLVDTGYEPAAPAVLGALADAEAGPVRIIVNTHAHEDHVGGNIRLGGEALIVAHSAAREALREPWTFIEGVSVPAKAPEALPTLTADGEITIHFNGEAVELIPLPGHTDADVIVHFTGSRVLHMGDRFFPGARRHIYPGGDPEAYVATMSALFERLPADTRVLAGHDPPQDLELLRAAHAATLEAIAWIRDGIAAGRTLEELQQEAGEHDLTPGWVAGVYRGLSR